jgi:GT2 family glycosyltransferase
MKNELEPLVSVIILNYNAGKLLSECIESVLETDYENFEVIVVDNASKDNSVNICKEKFNSVKIIENEKNLGYCEGNNVGIRKAKGEYVVILNPDTIVEKNWLTELVRGYNTFGDGIYQPRFLTTDNHKILQGTGNMIQLFGFGFARNKGDVDEGQYDKPEQIGYA